MKLVHLCALAILLLCGAVLSSGQASQEISLQGAGQLEPHNVKAEPVTYLGRPAVRVTDAGAADLDDAGRLAVVRGTSFQDGTIEVNLSGDTAPDAPPNLRGFVGISFRVAGTSPISNAFTFAQKTGDPKTRCNEIIPPNTSRCPDSPGRNCAPRIPANMNPMSNSGARSVDESQDSSVGNDGQTLRKRSRTANVDRERLEAADK